jgi:hypothetical protein
VLVDGPLYQQLSWSMGRCTGKSEYEATIDQVAWRAGAGKGEGMDAERAGGDARRGDGEIRSGEIRFPVIRQTVLDTEDPRGLAEFYRQLFGLRYRPGDEPPEDGGADPRGQDWLVLRHPAGGMALAFQKVAALAPATWPEGPVPQQLHLDTTVPSVAELEMQHERALALGARLLLDRSDDAEEPLRVYADPAGHPFCIFVS